MEPVLNPLYDSSVMSPKRPVPKPSQQHQNSKDQQLQGSPQSTPGQFTSCRRTCFRGTPWLLVLGIAVLVCAQVVWAVYTERFMEAVQQLLDKLQIATPGGLSKTMFILKAVLIGVTSFLGAVILLLGIAVKKQRRIKRTAASRAEWPHGCTSHATMGLSIGLALLLWLVTAGLVALMCCTFTATGAALAGDVAARKTLLLAVERAARRTGPHPTVQQLQSTVSRARTSFTAATRAAPPFITRSPWFQAMNSSLGPMLQEDRGAAASSGEDEAVCPDTCLDLSLVTKLLNKGNSTSTGCLCIQAALQEAQELLQSMWRNGLAALVALATLAALATWLLVYCLVACIITWRDHSEAQYCKHYLQHEEQRDGNINRWMWTAGVASPNSASGTMSSFPAFDLPPDAKRPPQLLAPEFTASTLSPSPRKQGKRLAQQQSDQHVEQGPAERQADDIERPAQIQPDQLPDSPRQQPDQLQLPTATPVSASLLGSPAGQVPTSSTGRRDAHRGAPSTSSTSSYRRRWQESVNPRR